MIYRNLALIILLFFASTANAAKVDTGNDVYTPIFEALYTGSFAEKEQAIRELMKTDIQDKQRFLDGILYKTLMVHKKSKKVVWVEKQGSKFKMTDAFTGEDLGLESKRKVKKFSINNSMRSQINALISTMDLDSEDVQKRIEAVKAMLANPEPAHADLLKE